MLRTFSPEQVRIGKGVGKRKIDTLLDVCDKYSIDGKSIFSTDYKSSSPFTSSDPASLVRYVKKEIKNPKKFMGQVWSPKSAKEVNLALAAINEADPNVSWSFALGKKPLKNLKTKEQSAPFAFIGSSTRALNPNGLILGHRSLSASASKNLGVSLDYSFSVDALLVEPASRRKRLGTALTQLAILVMIDDMRQIYKKWENSAARPDRISVNLCGVAITDAGLRMFRNIAYYANGEVKAFKVFAKIECDQEFPMVFIDDVVDNEM